MKLFLTLIVAHGLSGQPSDSPFDLDSAVEHETLDEESPLRVGCTLAETLLARSDLLKTCWGKSIDDLKSAAAAFEETALCGGGAVVLPEESARKLENAEAAAKAATAEVEAAERAYAAAKASVDAYGTWVAEGKTQEVIEDYARKLATLRGAEVVLEGAKQREAGALAARLAAKDAAERLRKKLTLQAARPKYEALGRSFAKSITPSGQGLEELLDAPERRAACHEFRRAWLDSFSTDRATEAKAKDETQKEESRTSAHFEDILRKAQGIGSALTEGNAVMEGAGAPDRLVASIAAGLGGEAKQDGTQLVLTLNMAGLLFDEEERLAFQPWVRNAFVRASVPLEETEEDPRSELPQEDGIDMVRRFSVTFGTSLYDETDPRLSTYDECFETVLAYHPYPIRMQNPQEQKRFIAKRRSCSTSVRDGRRTRIGSPFGSPSASGQETNQSILRWS